MTPRYTYIVKGRHWYFRRYGILEPLPGKPGDAEFEERRLQLIGIAADRHATQQREKRIKALAARRRRLEGDTGRRGLIYFVGASSGPVKIGFTTDLERRLRRLQMNSPRKLRVLAFCAGDHRDELRLHRRHEASRLHGEWFKRNSNLLADITAAKAAGTNAGQKGKLLTDKDLGAKTA